MRALVTPPLELLEPPSPELSIEDSGDRRSMIGRGASFEDRHRWRAVQRGYSTALASAMLAVVGECDALSPGLRQTLECRRRAAVNASGEPLQSLTRAPGDVAPGAIAFTGCCRQRWCAFCWGVRASEVRSRLVRIVREWGADDVWFLTLTQPNVSAEVLRATVRSMTARLRACVLAARREGYDVQLIRRNEVTYNSDSKDFHPHLHLLVKGRHVARLLYSEWMNRTPSASTLGQDLKKADPKRIFRELTKYAVKPMATGRDEGTTRREYWPADAIVTIFRALTRLRLFAIVGVKDAPEIEELGAELDAAEKSIDSATDTPAAFLQDARDVIPEDVTGLRWLEWDDARMCWRSGPLTVGDGNETARALVRRYAEALRAWQVTVSFNGGDDG